MRRVIPFFVLAFGLGLGVGCDGFSSVETGDPAEDPIPEAKTRVTVNPGLNVILSGPDTVAAADSFTVQVTVKNDRDRSVVIETSNSCLFRPGIYTNDKRVPMEGSNIGCATVITHHEIEEGEVHTRTFDMQAVRKGEEGTELVSLGYYTIRVSLDWKMYGETIEDTLKHPFYVSSEG